MQLRNSQPVPRGRQGLVLVVNAARRFRALERTAQPLQEGGTHLPAAEDTTNAMQVWNL